MKFREGNRNAPILCVGRRRGGRKGSKRTLARLVSVNLRVSRRESRVGSTNDRAD